MTDTLTYDGIPIATVERVKPALKTDHIFGGYFRFEYVVGGTDSAYGDELHILGSTS
ncbi:hypothetical protein R3Q06_10670 [Rhodococcus erythropolis]|uniref:hypothetical protein n=1 Tax=Rhodococcus erythropolis TaxID=1833 RepID=UPI00294952DF|nr:hypothetical protein [Rhodococcus erythropolis]MDV6273961.1 hypothetical protein [Rhodococcus erythropolis]